MPESTTLLRHEPVQARSNARLSALLDAAAATIDHVGYERLTTAMVAERAGASIGTVYRYFPDRIAVLQGVAARASDRFIDYIDTTLSANSSAHWRAAVEEIFDGFVAAFAEQSAFAALRFGDVLDLRPRENGTTGMGLISSRIAHHLGARHGAPVSAELTFHLEVAFALVDTLLARAFFFEPEGDAEYIDKARTIARQYFVTIYGEPSAR
ncbi:MAG: TetR/AcrR family transcriptional regulator [Terrimesophilobacter sp.]